MGVADCTDIKPCSICGPVASGAWAGLFTFLSILLCVRIFELTSYSLISLDAVLHTYQRRGCLALACVPFLCLPMLLCARIFELSSSSFSSLDPVLHAYQRRGFLALAGMQTRISDGK